MDATQFKERADVLGQQFDAYEPFPGLTGDQRFFLSYAQTWRQKSTDDSIRQQIVSNPHAPVQYRVNGVVRDMDAWYAAFHVELGDKLFLAPENRVKIW